jgi:hypothetical protein
MKLNHKNTFIGSIIAIFLGSSCCWLTTFAAWIGGGAIITAIVAMVDLVNGYLIILGVVLALAALFLFAKRKGCCSNV